MKKLFFLFVIIVLAGTGYYFWQHRYDYLFQGKEIRTQDQPENQESFIKQEDLDGAYGQNEIIGNEQQESDIISEEKNYQANITDYDCEQKCDNRKNTSSYRYCLEICGLSELEENKEKQNEECEKLSGLNRDVCFKNKAIKEKNDSICENIADEQLKKSCINRVLEDLL